VKALYISRGKEFLFTHDLDRLLLGLEELGLEITEALDEAAILTRYALETRYPGGFEPVTASEYREAIHHAEVALPGLAATYSLEAKPPLALKRAPGTATTLASSTYCENAFTPFSSM
jgi:HEPN domain